MPAGLSSSKAAISKRQFVDLQPQHRTTRQASAEPRAETAFRAEYQRTEVPIWRGGRPHLATFGASVRGARDSTSACALGVASEPDPSGRVALPAYHSHCLSPA